MFFVPCLFTTWHYTPCHFFTSSFIPHHILAVKCFLIGWCDLKHLEVEILVPYLRYFFRLRDYRTSVCVSFYSPNLLIVFGNSENSTGSGRNQLTIIDNNSARYFHHACCLFCVAYPIATPRYRPVGISYQAHVQLWARVDGHLLTW